MKHLRALPRLATAAAAGATALAGLVITAAPATATTAATASATYNCAFTITVLGVPVSATLPVPVTATVPDLPMWEGTTVPAGSVPLSADLDLDALTDLDGLAVTNAIVQLVGFDGVLGGSVGLDAAHSLSVGSVPVSSTLTAAPVLLDDLLSGGVLTGSGSLGSFTPQGTGLEDVSLPAAFDLVPSGTSGSSVGALLPVTFDPVTCTSATGAPTVVGRVNVAAAGTPWTPAFSKLSVVGPKHARRGKAVAFRASLPGGSGSVVARIGRRVVGRASLARGAAKVSVRGLRKGANRIVFTVGKAQALATVRVR